jgi:hypothetical protein
MLRHLLWVVVALMPSTTAAEPVEAFVGTWALERGFEADAYIVASSGAQGDYLICFNSGNVRAVMVSAGDETSTLARGACTVFSPRPDHGVVLDFWDHASDLPEHGVALGTFRVIMPATD